MSRLTCAFLTSVVLAGLAAPAFAAEPPPDAAGDATPPALFSRDADPNPYDFRDPPDAPPAGGRAIPIAEFSGAEAAALTPERLRVLCDGRFVRGRLPDLPKPAAPAGGDAASPVPPPDAGPAGRLGRFYPRCFARAARTAYLLAGGRHVAPVGVVGPAAAEDAGPGSPGARVAAVAGILAAGQIEHEVVDERALAGATLAPSGGGLQIGDDAYAALVLPAGTSLSAGACGVLRGFVEAGGMLIAVEGLPAPVADEGDETLREKVRDLFGIDPAKPFPKGGPPARRLGRGAAQFLPGPPGSGLHTVVAAAAPRDVALDHPAPALRVHHRRRGGAEIYFLVNESPDVLRVDAAFPFAGPATEWDADAGDVRFAAVQRSQEASTTVHVYLAGRESKLLVFVPGDRGLAAAHDRVVQIRVGHPRFVSRLHQDGGSLVADVDPAKTGEFYLEAELHRTVYAKAFSIPDVPPPVALDGPWSFQREGPGTLLEQRPAGSWAGAGAPAAGRARYARRIKVPADWLQPGVRVRLDLGDVRDCAEVLVNDRPVAELPWPPYAVELSPHLRAGENEVAVVVTAFGPETGGLLGPARLVLTRGYRVTLAPVTGR